MKKEGRGISVGKAAKKYGIAKQTLLRYAQQGKVETIAMPGVRGQARLLDELSVHKVAQSRVVVVEKKGREVRETPVYRHGEGIAVDAMDVAREYLEHCKNVGYGKKTHRTTERIVMGFAQRYDDLPYRGSEVQAYVNSMDVGQHSKQLYYGMLRTFYNWVDEEHHIPSPLRRGMAPTAKKREPRVLDVSEKERLLAVIEDHQDKVMVNTFLATGIRRGELSNLNREDVLPGHIHIAGIEGNKTGEGTVPIPPWLYRQLVGVSERDGHVFAGQDGERISKDAISHRIIAYMKKAGMKGKLLGPHTLRHTAACDFLEASGNLDLVRQLLRHKDIKQTQIYAQLRPKSVEAEYQKMMSGGTNGNFQFAKV